MVKLTEVEDEHFAEKPSTTKDNTLLADDDNDDDYTDTGMAPFFLHLQSRTIYAPIRGERNQPKKTTLFQSKPKTPYPY